MVSPGYWQYEGIEKMPLDLRRTRRYFEPSWLQGRDVHVVGAGALGSRIIEGLARDGVSAIHVYDDDAYEGLNQSNQRFLHRSLGEPKASAIGEYVSECVGEDVVIPHLARVDTNTPLTGFVFTAIDHQDTRIALWNGLFKQNAGISLLIDSRMGADGGRIVALDPNNFGHIGQYEQDHLYTQEGAEQTGCVTDDSIGSTADIVAGHALWRLKRWLHFEQGSSDPYDNFIGFGLIPSFESEVEQW
jgi:hypothetical protein